MGLYRLIETRVRDARDYARLDPVKSRLVTVLSAGAARCPAGRWLDIGAGSGIHREIFAGRAESYVALDPRPRGPGVVPGTGEALPFRDAAFDTAVLAEVLEHVPAVEPVLAEARRVLRPGGGLLVTAPFVFYEHEAPHDYRRFSRRGLEVALEAAGFDVLDTGKVCGPVAVLGLFKSLAFLATVGRIPGMWEPALAMNDWCARVCVLPLDGVVDRAGRWAQGHWAVARKRD
ncbi:MAG: methyltransferase domain-containing protein [Candidatus Eisenbacteria bacterium]|nr:methyltransferase domain-containing protein [Candidatus Eisenbacteria bacterium]